MTLPLLSAGEYCYTVAILALSHHVHAIVIYHALNLFCCYTSFPIARDPPLSNICIRQEFFTEAVAAELRGEWENEVAYSSTESDACGASLKRDRLNQRGVPPCLLFMSDVRTADWRIMTDGELSPT